MPRALAAITLLATLASIAPRGASGQLAPPRRPFLFKDDRGDIATAHARGDTAVTVIIARRSARPRLSCLVIALVFLMLKKEETRRAGGPRERQQAPSDGAYVAKEQA